jgi:hypothetical protein
MVVIRLHISPAWVVIQGVVVKSAPESENGKDVVVDKKSRLGRRYSNAIDPYPRYELKDESPRYTIGGKYIIPNQTATMAVTE